MDKRRLHSEYQGIEKQPDAQESLTWHVARVPGKRQALNKQNAADALIDKAEKTKVGIGAKVEHPFRDIKRQYEWEVALSRPKEEYCATRHAVCAVEFVDGA